MPEDIAITSSKSDIDPCSHGRDTDHQKVRTDGQMAFQLYIRSRLVFMSFQHKEIVHRPTFKQRIVIRMHMHT